MKELHELKEKLMDELKDYGRKEMTAGNLEVVDKLAHATKNLCKIMEDEEGYSGRYMPWAYDDGMDRRSYNDRSYNDRSYARRDSRGRYSSEGYSRHGLADKLRDLMEEAPDEQTRMEIKRLVDKM